MCVCTISVTADILVQYGIGTAADTKMILLVMKIEGVSEIKLSYYPVTTCKFRFNQL